ncbi:hypothetical protein C0J52_05797 [Blattella germanica]|nr:hypothetical protein C0J52_05797 [Blattella germanica]
MSKEVSVSKVNTFHPFDGGDLLKIIYEAKENGLKIKCHGGSFPINKEGVEILVSLGCMRRVTCYDPEEQTFTFEGGLTMTEVFRCLEYLSFTMELYGIIPDMTVADAISVGLLGSNGSIANCLKSCQVLHPDGTLVDWVWPDPEEAQDRMVSGHDERNYVPSLKTLVCGLGVVGIINSATFRCIPVHLAQETIYSTTVDDVLNDLQKLSDSLYGYMYWYPLLDKVIVKQATSVRLHIGHVQPFWKKCAEMFLWGVHWVLNRASPFISWYAPSFAKKLSQMQFDVVMKASACRMQHSFKPQMLVSVGSHCRGIKWCLPTEKLQDAIEDIGDWADHRFYLCSTPIVISLQTHKALSVRRPLLAPYSGKETCTLWTDWFSSRSITTSYSATMAEFEALLQKNGGRKCWSAGPVYASPLIGQMYPGFRQWCETRAVLDPRNMFKSAYVAESNGAQKRNCEKPKDVTKVKKRNKNNLKKLLAISENNKGHASDSGGGRDDTEAETKQQRVRLEVAYTWQCTDCPSILTTLQELKEHHNTVHDQSERYQCIECAKVYTVYKKFTRHVRLHRDHGKYKCRECGKSFSSKQAMDSHAVIHSEARPHCCPDCGKCKTIHLLNKHMAIHSDLKTHQCEVCGKQFREKSTLKLHTRIHTGAMPYKCEFCGRQFRFQGVYVIHRRQHTGERPYKCSDCKRDFTNWANYNKHLKCHHAASDTGATNQTLSEELNVSALPEKLSVSCKNTTKPPPLHIACDYSDPSVPLEKMMGPLCPLQDSHKTNLVESIPGHQLYSQSTASNLPSYYFPSNTNQQFSGFQ